jgi:hypothetical protein
VKKFDCGVIGEELCVARDPEHHYLIKFTIKGNGKWIFGCKRGHVRIRGNPFKSKITMTMGYYEKPVKLNTKIKESSLTLLMNMASNG